MPYRQQYIYRLELKDVGKAKLSPQAYVATGINGHVDTRTIASRPRLLPADNGDDLATSQRNAD